MPQLYMTAIRAQIQFERIQVLRFLLDRGDMNALAGGVGAKTQTRSSDRLPHSRQSSRRLQLFMIG